MKRKSLALSLIITIIFLIGCLFVLYSYYVDTFPKKAKTPKGIILISLDTLRADHLGCYGYHRNTSPKIDVFAKEGILFENALVQSSWTLPSHMSIMTSLYPFSHGVQKKDQRLSEDHLTLAELLREGKYRTAGFVDGGYLSAVFGFDQGFEIYIDQWVGIADILPKAQKWLTENKSKPFFLFIHWLLLFLKGFLCPSVLVCPLLLFEEHLVPRMLSR